MYPICVVLATLFIFTYVQAQTNPVAEPTEVRGISDRVEKCPDELTYKGKQKNRFGFSFIIPDGLIGFWNSASCVKGPEGCTCMGDHGRTIPLDKNAAIDVFAGYNSLVHKTADDSATEQIETVQRYARPNSLKIVEKHQTKLDTLTAERLVVSYVEEKTGMTIIHDQITALRFVARYTDPYPSHDYTVTLVTPEADCKKHLSTFERVVNSWRMIPAEP